MWEHIKHFFRSVRRMEVHIFAAYAAYFWILAIFPAMMLLISIIQLTPISPDSLRNLLQNVVPESLKPLTDYMIDELFAVDSPALLSLSAVTALWMTSTGVLSLQRGLNRINVARETRNGIWLRFRAVLFSLAGMLALVLLLALGLMSRRLVALILSEIDWLGELLLQLGRLRYVLSVLVLTLFFAALYKILPNRKVLFSAALPGALTTAVLWTVFSRLFTVYAEKFANYSIYYGSLSVIAMAMLWLFVCIFLFFCGGILNRQLERRKLNVPKQSAAKENDPKQKES
ncbi:MAG: YihY/virulence factor BrkB family protein [Oscillospiraceae bacterium]|nr:YihY/virulence factor BrkB family protein [Oscillospiraceae bacterium]